MGMGPIDIALWDFAGKYYDASIHELLGTYRETIPAYASTYHGDENGGLDSPEAFADFAEDCLKMGFGGFKIHGWGGGDDSRALTREVEAVHAVGDAVGDEMDLMHDLACELETFADALKFGRALDEAGFFWYEDPFRDGGTSQHAHQKLSQKTRHADPPDRAHPRPRGQIGLRRVRVDRPPPCRPRVRRRDHGRDEGRPRRGGLRHRHRVPRARPGPAPLHRRDAQLQLLRDGPGPP